MDSRAVKATLAFQDRGPGELARQAGVARKTAWKWQTNPAAVTPEVNERLMRALIEPAGSPDDPGKAA